MKLGMGDEVWTKKGIFLSKILNLLIKQARIVHSCVRPTNSHKITKKDNKTSVESVELGKTLDMELSFVRPPPQVLLVGRYGHAH